ncbi:MAG: hypothetical protein V4563_17615 [Pseudomonadota bacterium]
MALTNFPNGLSSFGIPVIGSGIPASQGKYFFVDYTNGSDGNTGLSTTRPFKTVDKAYEEATSGNDDVIVLMGSATHVLTEMLDVTKSRVHFVGMDGTFGRMYGQNAKLSIGVTTAATDIAAVQNTGIRNSFSNIKFISNNTVAEGLYTFAEGGEYTVFTNCEFYKSTDLDETTAAEFLANGDSTQFVGCTFGSLADIVADNCIRPCFKATAILAGKKLRDNVLVDCMFWRKAGGTEATMVYGANATDVERLLLLKNCSFISNALGAATPANAVGFGAAQTQGTVLLQYCTSVDCTVMAQASVGIYVDGAVPTFATTGVAKAS